MKFIQHLPQRLTLIILAIVSIIAVIALGATNWASFETVIEISKDDNLILRSLFTNRLFLATFRLLSIVGITIVILASTALLIKLFSAAVVNLWGLEIKSETIQFKLQLQEKDEIIERLKSENMTLSNLLDIFYETVEESEKNSKIQRERKQK